MTGSGNVLFISPSFFGYEEAIADAIRANGFDVDYYDERTSNNSFLKAIFRVKKSLLAVVIDAYYKRILHEIQSKKYNFFFLIKGEVVPQWFIASFKRSNPEAKMIFYTYDSIKYNKNSVYILKHFDVCYSFDFHDVEEYPALTMKHLFYSAEFTKPGPEMGERPYDLAFVGTLHSNRYEIIKNVMRRFKHPYLFYYAPAKWWFMLEKIIKKSSRKISWSEVHFNKLTKDTVAEIFKSSKCVIDIQRSGQTGLTMRTFEVLASGAVLITTNPYIKEVEFYDENRIIILNDAQSSDGLDGLKERVQTLTAHAAPMTTNFEKYFINNWVKEFFRE